MLWQNLREEEFAPMLQETHGVCAITIGCLEMHGQHLPLGTDALGTGKILELAAEQEPVCVLPHLFFGDILPNRIFDPVNGKGHYGHLVLSRELLDRLLEEICDEAARNGFRRILLFSGHGGNTAWLNSFLRAMVSKKKPYEVFHLFKNSISAEEMLAALQQRGRDSFPNLTDDDIAALEAVASSTQADGHAGFGESATMLGTYPELVRLDLCQKLSGMPTHKTDFLRNVGLNWGAAWQTECPNAYNGVAPVDLTPAIAEMSIQLAVEKTVQVLSILKDDKQMSEIM